MDWALVGSVALGIVVAYVALYFMTRFSRFTPMGLATFIGILIGGTAIEFLADRLDAKKANFGAYAVGLLAGLLLYVVLYWIRNGRPPALSR